MLTAQKCNLGFLVEETAYVQRDIIVIRRFGIAIDVIVETACDHRVKLVIDML